ncbi:hypothetical protein FSST1_006169 [Fusarium sambucinum]
MSDQIDESTQHNAVDSPDDAVPTKPSLRVLEAGSSSRFSREEDLHNGPLLLALGDGQEDPIVSHPELYLTSQYSDYRQPEESVLPYMPLGRPETLPTMAMTSSTTSQSGPSLSVPPESIPCSDPSRQAFPVTSEAVPDPNQLFPGEVTESSVVRDSDAFSFSQSYEFSWHEDSGLCFGGEPFGVVRTPDDRFSKVDPGSERALSEPHEPAASFMGQGILDGILASLSMDGIGSSIEHLSPMILHGDLELESATSSVLSSTASSSGIIDFDVIAEPSDPKLLIAMHKYAEWAVELLMDDFYRSCASQVSKGRSTRASENVAGSASNDEEGKRKGVNGRSRVELKSGKRKAMGGDEESEDEGARDKKRKPSVTEKSNKRRRWACPYVKWNPKKYTCKVGPTQLRGINAHIKNVHFKEHCDRCWSIHSTSEEELAHRKYSQTCFLSDRPPGFMTKEMSSEIFENKPSGLSHEEQWFRFYSILFPGEPQGFSPYVNEMTSDFMDRAEVRFRSEESRKILEEVILESEFGGAKRKQIIEVIWTKYLARIFREDDLNNQNSCTSASHKTQVIENSQSSQADIPGTGTDITECDPLYHASSPSPGETCISHQFPWFEFPDLPTFDPQPVEGETVLGNQTSNAWLDSTEFENFLISIQPRGSQGCSEGIFDRPFDSNFEDSLYSKLDVNGDYQENISGASNWVENELLLEQA